MKWKKIGLDLSSMKRWDFRRPQVVLVEEDVGPLFEAWEALLEKEAPAGVLADQVVLDADGLSLDVGGPMWTGRHMYSFNIDGLDIRIPATDVSIYVESVDRAPTEVLPGGAVRRSLYANPYWNWLLSDNQLNALKAYLMKIQKEADAIAKTENARFNELVEKGQGRILAKRRPVDGVEEA